MMLGENDEGKPIYTEITDEMIAKVHGTAQYKCNWCTLHNVFN